MDEIKVFCQDLDGDLEKLEAKLSYAEYDLPNDPQGCMDELSNVRDYLSRIMRKVKERC